jgi:hypothetical protein
MKEMLHEGHEDHEDGRQGRIQKGKTDDVRAPYYVVCLPWAYAFGSFVVHFIGSAPTLWRNREGEAPAEPITDEKSCVSGGSGSAGASPSRPSTTLVENPL